MKEELTREVLEAMKGCEEKDDCNLCPVDGICPGIYKAVPELATALLEEMDKPKVWDGAPEDAIEASVAFFKKGEFLNHVCKTYTRELPKTRARQIAEEVAADKETLVVYSCVKGRSAIDLIEEVLNKYAAELGTTT